MNKKKLIRTCNILCLIFVLFLSISGCSFKSDTKNKIKNDDKTFILGFDAEFPPYGYKDDNGDYVGFDLDLAQEVCNRNGWKLVKQPIDWDSKDMELKSGSIDCIWNGFTYNGREDKYTWSTPYVDNSQVVVVRSDSSINKLNDLQNKIVAVQADSSALEALTGDNAEEKNKELANSFSTLQQVSDYNSAFMNLESGAVDAICMDIGVAKYQVKQRGDTFRILDEQVSTEQYAIGFKLGNTKLRNKVQDTLLDMLDDGTFEKIANKWNLEDCISLNHDDKFKDVKVVNKETNTKADTGFTSIVKSLGSGMIKTIGIFFFTLLFSLPLGLLLTFVRMSRFKIVQGIGKVYISIMRGTPLILQLLVVYFGPYYVFGLSLPYSYRFYAVIIGFSLNYAAYFAEIFRSGIQSIPLGQKEAAQLMGYSKSQTFCRIILPQMIKRVLPPVTNEVITLVKDTSLAFALAYTEMFTLAKQIAAKQTSIMPLFVAGLFYYIFNFLIAFIMSKIEKKLEYYR
ncbi:ABC transporter permease subunit [Clostridium sp. MSJ-8]|nr:ABC transporter permease subunit [Clostridium sp. MSJ-8]